MKLGITAGVGLTDRLERLHAEFMRVSVRPGDPITDMVRVFVGRSIVPLFLTYQGTDLRGLLEQAQAQLGATGYMLQFFNEIGLTYQGTPDSWMADTLAAYTQARDAGFEGRILSGGVANLEGHNLELLKREGRELPHDMALDFHRYPKGVQSNRSAPQSGFKSRQEEFDTVHQIANGREVTISEFGYHTAPEQRGFPHFDHVQLSDDQVRDYLWQDIELFEMNDITLAAVYQDIDGPDPNNFIHRFGIFRYTAGSEPIDWPEKPSAAVFGPFQQAGG